VHAVGDAFVQTLPDTVRIRNPQERDWMRGDTIVARFDTSAAPPGRAATASARPATATTGRDTTNRPRLQRVDAILDAQAFYQAANPRGPELPPSLCYSRGRQIVLTFANNEAERVIVTRGDSTVADGVCLEPSADSTGARPARGGAGQAPVTPDRRGTTPAAPARTPAAPPASRPQTTPARRP
jgi:hypothetical protein